MWRVFGIESGGSRGGGAGGKEGERSEMFSFDVFGFDPSLLDLPRRRGRDAGRPRKRG